MQSRDLVYWLQGYMELSEKANEGKTLNEEQVKCVRNHLAMVFKHEIDPAMGDKKHQDELTKIHASDPVSILGKSDVPLTKAPDFLTHGPIKPGDVQFNC